MAPPMVVTEDTPPDMLAGSMDLTVVLPDGHPLNMSVERSTPMMDLLVQVTTANKMSPAGYIIKPHNDRGLLPYKPSTPIGALDAWTIYIVPKQHGQCPSIKKPLKPLNQPFEQTFRLQVHLPRNQLYVSRISPKTRLADILVQVCSEKNLDPLKYSLRHPCHLDQVLNLNCSLADYKLQEVTLVCNRTHPVEVSTVDIMSLQRDTSNPAYRRNLCEGSVSSGSLEGRSLSPVPSDESSASPPPLALPPSRPTRKRRPAPKPPTINQKQIKEEVQQNGIQTSTVINHSRNSSDSSGYHEASVLSESPQSTSVPESLPHRKPSHAPLKSSLSRSMTDVAAIEPSLQQATSYNSISSLTSITGRKKKIAPPPPPAAKDRASSLTDEQQRTPSISSTASSTTTLDGNEVAKSATLPPSSRLNCAPPLSSPSPVDVEPPAITPRAVVPEPRPRSRLMTGSDDSTIRPSQKKAPAPQPRPKKPMLPIENACETKQTSTTEETQSPKHQSFMNKKLPNAVFTSHKACINELAFKLEKQISTDSLMQVEIEKIGTCLDNSTSPASTGSDGVEREASSAVVVALRTEADEGNSDVRMADEEIDRIFTDATRNHSDFDMEADEDHVMSLSTLPSPPFSLVPCELKNTCPVEEPLDWEYRLPAPPTFRDETKSPSVTEFGTITIANLSDVIGSENKPNASVNEVDLLKSEKTLDKTDHCEVDQKISVSDSKDDMQSNKIDTKIEISRSANTRLVNNKLSTDIQEEEIALTPIIKSNSKTSITLLPKDVVDHKQQNKQQLPSTLENFCITTYKDTKPLEVFEDDSIKSSTGEKRDKSKDDAVFRAPKPRVKEPNLSRTSSFSMENKLNGPLIKRSVSYVSLLAANIPRNSQPYRAHLQSHSSDSQDAWPRLRKTTSELNIDSQVEANNGPSQLQQDFTSDLQSVQVMRNILSQSYANLSFVRDESDHFSQTLARDPPTSDKRLEDTNEKINEDTMKWRSQPEELPVSHGKRKVESDLYFDKKHSTNFVKSLNEAPKPKIEHASSLDENRSTYYISSLKETPKPKIEHASSLDQDQSLHHNSSVKGAPSINLSTWSERPKRQVSIKNDHDYISGFGKKSIVKDKNHITHINNESSLTSKIVHSINGSVRVELSKNENTPLKEKSKSISDLSRIPIVRSVELKKPFQAQMFDRSNLKPVLSVEDITRSNPHHLDDSESSDCFIGVNSLAKRFGVPHKRPVSMHASSTVNIHPDCDWIRPVEETVTNSHKHFSNVAFVNNDQGNFFSNRTELEDRKKSNLSRSHSQVNVATSAIKALAKMSSGGFSKNAQLNDDYAKSSDQLDLDNRAPNRVMNLTKVDIFGTNEANRNNYMNQDKNNVSLKINSVPEINKKGVTSSVYLRQNQASERRPRPVSLQPVVKGFKISIDPSTMSSNESLPSSTKESKSNQSHSSNNITTGTVNRVNYNRALSTSDMPTKSKETAKEKVTIRMNSAPPPPPSKIGNGGIPPPPPLMPVLRPAAERKGVKLLPPPEADPRDMLMHSIRSFGKDSLKKVSK